MIDLPKITTIDSKFHLDVPFWLNGIFRTIFKTAKWNPNDNVFVTPATDQNLQKWKKFHVDAMTVAASLKKANLAPYSRVPVLYALTDINAFPLLGGFICAARKAGWTEAEITECWRRPNTDPPCRSKNDPGRGAAFLSSSCG